jgi:hypothetical protein
MAASRPREPDAPARLIDVALGGALGTGVRLLLAGPVVLLAAPPGPLRLLSINVGGALLLGLLLGLRERSEARVVERQAVDERGRGAVGDRGGHVLGVGGQDRGAVRLEVAGDKDAPHSIGVKVEFVKP